MAALHTAMRLARVTIAPWSCGSLQTQWREAK